MTAYRFMQANRGRYTVTEMAGLFGVSRGAYYKWARGGVSQRRSTANAELVRLIREIVARHHRRYGSPRVRQELRQVYGKRVSLKRVARLMREHGLNARRRRKFIPTTDSQHRRRPGDGSQEPRPGRRPDIPFRSRGAVLRAFLSRGSGRAVPGGSPEHEPQGQLLGQRLRRIIFQDAQGGAGNAGRQAFCCGGQAVGFHVH